MKVYMNTTLKKMTNSDKLDYYKSPIFMHYSASDWRCQLRVWAMLAKTRNDICEVVYWWHVTRGLLNFVVHVVTVHSELKYASMQCKG